MLDADDDCPAELGPVLVEKAAAVRSNRPAVVAIAQREYETWFLAGVESLRGYRHICRDACSPAQPEAIRGAKERLRSLLEPGEHYLETADQSALTAVLDLDAAAAGSPSFARCRTRVLELLRMLAEGAAQETAGGRSE